VTLFLSKTVNRLDKKGRISVPAGFRAALANQAFQGVVLFPSHHHQCLEGFGWNYMEEMNKRLSSFDLFSDEQDDMATAIFADSVQLPFDKEGRIILTEDLIQHAGLEDQAAFVGLGQKFQIWAPGAFEKRRETARKNMRDNKLTLPKGGKDE
jgi:MraZ protein